MAFADDYVGVHERLDQFLVKYPEGRIQTAIAHLSESLVVMQATVYRDADDKLPCIAHSQLGIPGKTNFTRDSEVENAETSAVGRALAFMGFETKKGIASREEVNSRRPTMADAVQEAGGVPVERKPSGSAWSDLAAEMIKEGLTGADMKAVLSGQFSAKALDEWLAAEGGRTVFMLIDLAKTKRKVAV